MKTGLPNKSCSENGQRQRSDQEYFLMGEYKRYREEVTGVPHAYEEGEPDPPDFWLTESEGSRIAVEVTRVLHERDRTVTATQWGLAKQVEREAIENNELYGRYIVVFYDPFVGNKQKARIRQFLLDFVRSTANEERTPQKELSVSGRFLCGIRRFVGEGAKLFPVGGGVEDLGGYEHEVRDQLSQLLQKTIKSKAKKMARFSQAVLVMYDLFGLADKSDFIDCVRAVPESHLFDEIYVVQDRGRGFPVHVN